MRFARVLACFALFIHNNGIVGQAATASALFVGDELDAADLGVVVGGPRPPLVAASNFDLLELFHADGERCLGLNFSGWFRRCCLRIGSN